MGCFRKESFFLSLLMLCVPVLVYAEDADQGQVSSVTSSSDLGGQEGVAEDWHDSVDSCDTDCVKSGVGNYNSLVVSGFGLDLLLDVKGGRGGSSSREARLPVYTFDFSNLFRRNTHYIRAVRIAGSRFAFCFGGGWRVVSYAFPRLEGEGVSSIVSQASRRSGGIKRAALRRDGRGFVVVGGGGDANVLGSIETEGVNFGYGYSVKRSVLELKYIDFLLRFRFNTSLESPKSGFFTWAGLKVGHLYDVKSLIEYEVDRRSRSLVRSGDFGGLSKVSCLGEVGVGYARLGVEVSYDVVPLFRAYQGVGGDSNLLSRHGFSVGLVVIDLI